MLALAQMRLVLAKMVWKFDLEAIEGKVLDWQSQKVYFILEKEPDIVRLRLRE